MGVSLSPNRLQREEQYFGRYAIVLSTDVDLDTAMKPEYFAHVGNRLRPFDTIRLMAEDGSFYADTVVASAGQGFAKLVMVNIVQMASEETSFEAEPTAFVKWGGPHGKWQVIRTSDKMKLKDGFDEKADAEKYATDYARTVS